MIKKTIRINPPPDDGRCECCGTYYKDCKPFPDDDFFKKALLFKNFREYCGTVSASWECIKCFGLNDRKYNLTQRKYLKSLEDKNTH